MAKAPDAEAAKNSKKDNNRGTQNELEILGLIIANNPLLRQRVFEKLRAAKTRQNANDRQNTNPGPDGDKKAG